MNDGDYPRAPSSVHRSGGMISADVAVGGPGSLGQFDPPVAKLEATYRASGGAPCDGDAAPAQPDTDASSSAQPEMSWSRWLSCFQAADAALREASDILNAMPELAGTTWVLELQKIEAQVEYHRGNTRRIVESFFVTTQHRFAPGSKLSHTPSDPNRSDRGGR